MYQQSLGKAWFPTSDNEMQSSTGGSVGGSVRGGVGARTGEVVGGFVTGETVGFSVGAACGAGVGGSIGRSVGGATGFGVGEGTLTGACTGGKVMGPGPGVAGEAVNNGTGAVGCEADGLVGLQITIVVVLFTRATMLPRFANISYRTPVCTLGDIAGAGVQGGDGL